MMIEARNLTKRYRELLVIDNFSHSFEEGKIYGIMGENGAGKSTLFRCIAGIESYEGSHTSQAWNTLSSVFVQKERMSAER